MSRLVEITKDGNNYTVDPNAHPGSSILYAWGVFYDDSLQCLFYTLTETPHAGSSLITSEGESGIPHDIPINSYHVQEFESDYIIVRESNGYTFNIPLYDEQTGEYFQEDHMTRMSNYDIDLSTLD